jgi:hypothetical protein
MIAAGTTTISRRNVIWKYSHLAVVFFLGNFNIRQDDLGLLKKSTVSRDFSPLFPKRPRLCEHIRRWSCSGNLGESTFFFILEEIYGTDDKRPWRIQYFSTAHSPNDVRHPHVLKENESPACPQRKLVTLMSSKKNSHPHVLKKN